MLGPREHDDIVGRLFACAMGDRPWSPTLDRIAGYFRADKALLRVTDEHGDLAAFNVHGYAPDYVSQFYAGELCRNDPRFAMFERAKTDSIYFDHALYDVEEMNRNPHVRASNDALGVTYSLGTHASLALGGTGQLALMNNARRGHATADEICAFRRLAPHVAQALILGQVLEQQAATQDALLEALTNKADGVVLLDRSGAPSFMNDAAQSILAAGDGLALTQGLLVTQRGPETRRLQHMIRDALTASRPSEARPRGQVLVTRPSGKRPYVVRVMGAPRTERFLTGTSIACVLNLHDLAAVRLPSRTMLGAVFGLSEREADLAVALVRCAGLADAAADCGMAFNTARNHLHSIFRKSGTASQTEAVQLFSRLA